MTDVVIAGVAPDSPAAQARLQPGDIVREVDGRTIDNSTDLLTAVQLNLGARTQWVVQRGDSLFETPPGAPHRPAEGPGRRRLEQHRGRQDSPWPAWPAAPRPRPWGLMPGDLLLWVDDRRVLLEQHVTLAVEEARAGNPAAAVPVAILRRGEIVELELPFGSRELTGMQLEVRPRGAPIAAHLAGAPLQLRSDMGHSGHLQKRALPVD